ncbi:cupin domain-containing protein [Roseovarius sp. S4756]|uniref:cupin domain-containing protein n=1 Tax=Roseovarius maritimus TaxID=3342637 RepID=UPI00372A49E6
MSAEKHLKRIAAHGPDAAELTEWPEMDPANLVSGNPVQKGVFYDEVETVDYSVGIWECTAFVDNPGPYPVDEFMLLLDGTVEMAMPDGSSVTVGPGDAFVIPKGLECQWKMPQTVRKIFMILDGAAPGSADNAGLRRVTVPALDVAGSASPGALATRETHFVNHDGRMAVHVEKFHERMQGPAPQTRRRVIHVLAGGVKIDGDTFEAGSSLYLLPGSGLDWEVAAGTRLLIASCDLRHDST